MINMSAGVINNLPIYRQVFTIPEASVQTMDSSLSYSLISTNNEFFAIPIACYIYIINSTIGYDNFVHLHLSNKGSAPPDLCAVLSENACYNGKIESNNIYSMLVNCQQPTFFGGTQRSNDLSIFFDTIPTSGDGDMIVTLFYTINGLF